MYSLSSSHLSAAPLHLVCRLGSWHANHLSLSIPEWSVCQSLRVSLQVCCRSGVVTWPTACVTSRPRPSTLPSRTRSKPCSSSRRPTRTVSSSQRTSSLAVSLVRCHSCLFTRSTTPERGWPTTWSRRRREARDSTAAWSTSTARRWSPTVSPVSIVASSSRVSASSCTEGATSVSTTRSNRLSSATTPGS